MPKRAKLVPNEGVHEKSFPTSRNNADLFAVRSEVNIIDNLSIHSNRSRTNLDAESPINSDRKSPSRVASLDILSTSGDSYAKMTSSRRNSENCDLYLKPILKSVSGSISATGSTRGSRSDLMEDIVSHHSFFEKEKEQLNSTDTEHPNEIEFKGSPKPPCRFSNNRRGSNLVQKFRQLVTVVNFRSRIHESDTKESFIEDPNPLDANNLVCYMADNPYKLHKVRDKY